jgi:PAS domain S-box-containing protein
LENPDNIPQLTNRHTGQKKPAVSPMEQSGAVRQESGELLERAERINHVLYSIANAVNTTLNLEDLYQAIHKSLHHIIDVTNFFITIINTTTNMLDFPYYVDTKDVTFPPISNFGAANTLTGQVVLRRKPLLFNQKELEEREKNNGIQGSTPLIWLGVPLFVRDEVIGIIAVQSYTDPELFSEEDLHLLTAVSDQIAIAIDRKRSIDQLQKSELRFRQLFEQSNDAIIVHDLRGRILDCNFQACKLLGYAKTELMKTEMETLYHKKTPSSSGTGKNSSQKSAFFETQMLQSTGIPLDVEISSHPIDKKDGGIIQTIIRDITERKQAEIRLIHSEKKYRDLFTNAQVGLFRIHYTPQPIIECNSSLAKMFGYDDHTLCLENFPLKSVDTGKEKHVNLLDLVCEHGKITDLAFSREIKDGKRGWFRFSADYSIQQSRIEGSVTDITEARIANEEKLQLQKELERSRKMEALGLLVSGVAHDLNNILAGIVSYPELILLKHPNDPTLRPPLEAIQDSGKRAAEIVGDLLTLARSAASVRKTHDLHSLIGDYLESPEYNHLQKLHPEIRTRTHLNAPDSEISCSSVHIKKCLMNLVTNGFEAITGIGQITLSTTNTTISGQSGDNVKISKYVVLSISDTGAGIAEKDQEHIFEPFYSRKKMGRSGTGLGLTVVWNTMQDHNGKVTIESSESGTTFHLSFPVNTGDQIDRQEEPAQIITVGHEESILVVDDEPHLRDIACQILTTAGYSPRAVATGEEALNYLEKHSADLILLDMQMDPGMNGYETYRQIIKMYPGQKAIIASGFSESDDVKSALDLGVGSFIKKPYTASQLSHVVAKELLK